jgi:hypothetical protein
MKNETLPAYRLKSFDDLKRLKTPKFIIEGLLFENTTAMIVGPSGSYKSTLAIDLAVCLQNGLPWQSRETRQSNVAIFNHEDGGGFKVRYLAASKYYGIDEPQVYWDGEVPNLLDSAQIDARIAAMKAAKIKVVIIDTLAHAMTGAEENSAKDMGEAFKNIGMIQRRLGATIIVVHHTGKDSSRGARGSSALKAAIDTEIKVTTRADQITIKQTKQRHSSLGSAITLRPVEVPVGLASACILVPGDSSRIKVETKTVTDQKAIALNMLQQLADEHGNVSSVEYQNMLQKDVSFSAKHNEKASFIKAFKRNLTKLKDDHLITVGDGVITLLTTESAPVTLYPDGQTDNTP